MVQPLGSIPAWAGETYSSAILTVSAAVYPRVGGGNYRRQWRRLRQAGLSPRGRGKHYISARLVCCGGSIPAWAGETARISNHRLPLPVYPRVGGGNVSSLAQISDAGGLSPRGRGKQYTSNG